MQTKIWKSKSFYVLLTAALVVAGVSGYVAKRSSDKVLDELSEFPPIVSQAPISTPSLPTATPLPTVTPSPVRMQEAALPEEEAVTAAAQQEPEAILLPLQGEMVAAFSGDELVYNKTMKDWRTHNGVDIRSDVGAQVKASADGVVAEAFLDPQMGHTVIIEHSGGMLSYYQGLQSSDIVKVGDTVKRGQIIGGVGTTAEAEYDHTPHLHFALQKDGLWVDPFSCMKEN